MERHTSIIKNLVYIIKQTQLHERHIELSKRKAVKEIVSTILTPVNLALYGADVLYKYVCSPFLDQMVDMTSSVEFHKDKVMVSWQEAWIGLLSATRRLGTPGEYMIPMYTCIRPGIISYRCIVIFGLCCDSDDIRFETFLKKSLKWGMGNIIGDCGQLRTLGTTGGYISLMECPWYIPGEIDWLETQKFMYTISTRNYTDYLFTDMMMLKNQKSYYIDIDTIKGFWCLSYILNSVIHTDSIFDFSTHIKNIFGNKGLAYSLEALIYISYPLFIDKYQWKERIIDITELIDWNDEDISKNLNSLLIYRLIVGCYEKQDVVDVIKNCTWGSFTGDMSLCIMTSLFDNFCEEYVIDLIDIIDNITEGIAFPFENRHERLLYMSMTLFSSDEKKRIALRKAIIYEGKISHERISVIAKKSCCLTRMIVE